MNLTHQWMRLIGLSLAWAIAASGCAPGGGPIRGAERAPGAPGAGPTRITVAIMEDLSALNSDVARAVTVTSTAGAGEVERLVNAGLAVIDDTGNPRPELGEAVPSVEQGTWKLFPDGRMETTLKIKPAGRWHDGTPFTAEDVAFSATVLQDRELGVFRTVAFNFLESVEATDAGTVLVRWKQPYIDADRLFTGSLMPRHLLEQPYRTDKESFTLLPYWTHDYVGTGAYKLREWARGSHLIVEAFDAYIGGRPKIDIIDVRIIEDRNTLLANLLAGELDMTLGRGISLEQAILIRDQWKDGKPEVAFTSWITIYPQFIEANPPAITDVRLRKALMHAIDRQQMVDTVQYSMVPVAHNMLSPHDQDYEATLGSAVRYDYDPRKATQIIEGLGFTRGADGSFRDASGQKLALDYRTMDGYDIHLKTIFPVTEFWRKIGLDVEPIVFPQARAREREWVSTFPGFLMYRQPNTLRSLRSRLSANTPLPENRYVGQNYARYMNPDFDALINQYFVTIPKDERLEVARKLIHHVTDQLPMMGLYYDTQPVLVRNRLANVTVRGAEGSNQAWNAHAWTVRN